MKHLIFLSAILSINVFSATDSCPSHQNLLDLNENFELSIKSNVEIKGHIYLESGRSTVYKSALMTISSHSRNLSIPKGSELPLMFASEDFYRDEFSEDKDRSVQGVFFLKNKMERIDFTINDRSDDIPTVKDLEMVLGNSFSITCKLRDVVKKENTENKFSAATQE